GEAIDADRMAGDRAAGRRNRTMLRQKHRGRGRKRSLLAHRLMHLRLLQILRGARAVAALVRRQRLLAILLRQDKVAPRGGSPRGGSLAASSRRRKQEQRKNRS